MLVCDLPVPEEQRLGQESGTACRCRCAPPAGPGSDYNIAYMHAHMHTHAHTDTHTHTHTHTLPLSHSLSHSLSHLHSLPKWNCSARHGCPTRNSPFHSQCTLRIFHCTHVTSVTPRGCYVIIVSRVVKNLFASWPSGELPQRGVNG